MKIKLSVLVTLPTLLLGSLGCASASLGTSDRTIASASSIATPAAPASVYSGQPLYHTCSATAGDNNPEHSSESVKLYATNLPSTSAQRPATLVLQGVLFIGYADTALNQFTSYDGRVTASFGPNSKGASVQFAGSKTTYSQCVPDGLGD